MKCPWNYRLRNGGHFISASKPNQTANCSAYTFNGCFHLMSVADKYSNKVRVMITEIWTFVLRGQLKCDLLIVQSYSQCALWWVELWGFLWWAPSAKRKDHHGVSSGWSSTLFHSNTGIYSAQCEQIPIIFGVCPFRLTPFFFRSITF